ncbi:NAD(P)-dependent oxidoreductase [Gluconacetobacter entanii]|uniref:NAD(P)-dependent oxidoreductase n=1 Tax=Gluconacetobacter entanii TaxID=108528 RepID=A0ABT3K9P4_9PROT|nr:NAD(P)-dependent oxidoreductase [Gluconacetobacter entanii]MCW4592160.1 NAD(P)-dependent oxidoreductase [Gluconacetobacter entanii]MCW4595831.1 NAD(P)-dependent oxidoreductase [Gluconacetobacter entanii]NPC87375.1 NAD(P)-dependent oxidoreductase [Gluconacetobacter entanii]
MRILVVGNMGYLGPVVVRHLRKRFPAAILVGYDNCLFGQCLTTAGPLPEIALDAQYFGDVRDIPPHVVNGADAIVHLAAISNDPMGSRFEEVTDQINRGGSLHLARMAADAGVRHFAFASSCSVYGVSDGLPRRESDPVEPLTAYARSKIDTERALMQMDLGEMTVTCLRFATACGFSDRLRLDLVINDFVASALTCGKITVLSDGTPWRPLIHVRDMARAIEWAITRGGERRLVVNAGSDTWNYTVRDLAEAVAQHLPGTTVSINTDAPPDRRSYRVDFSLFRTLAADFVPRVSLSEAIAELIAGLREVGFSDADFRNSSLIRLHALRHMIDAEYLGQDLRWVRNS